MPSQPETNTYADNVAACRALLRGGSRTFYAASHVLPGRVSRPATVLYAFCRLADDAIDLRGGKRAALARLYERLNRAYEGRPFPTPVDHAFAEVVARFAVPRVLPEALLEGLAWDAEGRRYEDFSALTAYAVRVAGAVGAMMTLLMGARAPQLVARACDLGVAMQFTNIARDVGEDARAGRLYLPLDWLRSAGIDPDRWLERPMFSAALGEVVQRLLQEADILYDRSRSGIAGLPAACRPGIQAARLLYAEIGREVERNDCDSIARRATVGWQRKLRLLTRSLGAALPIMPYTDAEPLPEARYLIEAIAAALPVRLEGETHDRERSEGRLVRLLELFERLERRTQFEHTG